MKKFFKNNFKTILAVGATAIICISGTAFAALQYQANSVSYTTTKNESIKNVEEALNDLYLKSQTNINPSVILENFTLNAGDNILNIGFKPKLIFIKHTNNECWFAYPKEGISVNNMFWFYENDTNRICGPGTGIITLLESGFNWYNPGNINAEGCTLYALK